MSTHKDRKDKTDTFIKKINIDMINCIDEMRMKRDDLQKDIKHLTEDQTTLHSDILLLTSQLTKTNKDLSKKFIEHQECEKLIEEYKTAFEQLLKGSETLLTNMRKSIETIAPHLLVEHNSDAGSLTSRRTRSSRHSQSTTGSLLRVDLSRGGVVQPLPVKPDAPVNDAAE